ncbi:MAG: ABC transporter permease [Pirellulales bacterium]
MSLFKIAWRSIQQRGLGSTLTILSMALGVALIVAVLVLRGMVDESFRRGAQGYNLIVGKKGSPMQLVLNTVYHLGTPGEPIPWTFYQEFLPGGEWGDDIAAAIPICLGDNFQGYRVVGTTPDLFTKIEYGAGKRYEFAAGRNFGEDAAHAAGEHGDHDHDHGHGHDHGHSHGPAKAEPKPRQPTVVSPDDSDENEEHHHDLPPHFLEAVVGAASPAIPASKSVIRSSPRTASRPAKKDTSTIRSKSSASSSPPARPTIRRCSSTSKASTPWTATRKTAAITTGRSPSSSAKFRPCS